MVDYNGDMLLCSHDWKKAARIGNLGDSHIWDLWRGEYLQRARKLLRASDRGFPPCSTCDVRGDVIGRENYDAWPEVVD